MIHPRNIIKPTMAGLFRWLPIKSWIQLTGQKHIFPFYHGVYEETPTFLKGLYTVLTPHQFELHLDELLRHFKPMSLDDLKSYVREGKRGQSPGFFLSFDDGLRSCYETIASILLRKGIPAAFYVNSDFVDNRGLFYHYKNALLMNAWLGHDSRPLDQTMSDLLVCQKRDIRKKLLSLSFFAHEKREKLCDLLDVSFDQYLSQERPYMSWAELKELEQKGFVIGSHGCQHQAYGDMSEKKRRLNTKKSFQILQNRLEMTYLSFSFPFTDDRVPNDFIDWMEKELMLDWSFGTAGLKNDPAPKHLQRIPMEHLRFKTAKKILLEEFSYFMVRGLLRKNTVRRDGD